MSPSGAAKQRGERFRRPPKNARSASAFFTAGTFRHRALPSGTM
ncbi:hypothetical protein C7S16_6680 [Burkholderia thailandensis]|uniref:Uncharacterized protein n=1 Tax=Burkholderia thailandensis TaxID=57975 RepID=A0AAW9D142_BURTH|nr:hypothetical protein [Burkholderia thailandensis]MDW9253721.1 hypothetical protein [Burkholderia thailandensis]